jgi:hypothetical protein
MGRVYLSHTPGGRPVALKIIRAEYADDPGFRRRFELEVTTAQRVQGMYTAPVIDADTRAEHPWLATAYVPGPSLQQAVGVYGALPEQSVFLLVAGVAEALQSIHGAGIVHRDLKPSNVILAADGPRVIDFGIARAVDTTSVTQTGLRVGTPAFMAPEQVRGQSSTPAVDIFALGSLACFAATAELPFGGGLDPLVPHRILEQEPDLDRCPQRLRELVIRCLAKDPRERPAPAQVIDLCRQLSGDTRLQMGDDWLPRPVAAVVQRIATAPVPPPAPERRPSRRRLAILATTFVVLAAGIGIGTAAAFGAFRPSAAGTPEPGVITTTTERPRRTDDDLTGSAADHHDDHDVTGAGHDDDRVRPIASALSVLERGSPRQRYGHCPPERGRCGCVHLFRFLVRVHRHPCRPQRGGHQRPVWNTVRACGRSRPGHVRNLP